MTEQERIDQTKAHRDILHETVRGLQAVSQEPNLDARKRIDALGEIRKTIELIANLDGTLRMEQLEER